MTARKIEAFAFFLAFLVCTFAFSVMAYEVAGTWSEGALWIIGPALLVSCYHMLEALGELSA